VETELGGAGIWDVMLPAPDRIEEAYFDSVEALEKKLLAIEISAGDRGETPLQLTSAMSLADTDHIARDASVLKMVPIEARLLGMRQVMGSFFDTLLSGWAPGSEKGDKRYLRIMLRSRERSGANQKDQLIAMVNQTVAQHVAAPAWQRFFAQDKAPDSNHPKSAQSQSSQEGRTPFLVSGYYVLLTRLVENVVADQWVSFLCATLGIGIAMAVALRSVKLAMIAILPSALPNMVVLGTLGWNDIHVNLGAAMIAAAGAAITEPPSFVTKGKAVAEIADKAVGLYLGEPGDGYKGLQDLDNVIQTGLQSGVFNRPEDFHLGRNVHRAALAQRVGKTVGIKVFSDETIADTLENSPDPLNMHAKLGKQFLAKGLRNQARRAEALKTPQEMGKFNVMHTSEFLPYDAVREAF
jgi:hypothetical protein